MSPESVKKLISNLWAGGECGQGQERGWRVPTLAPEREALTCLLQHLRVPVQSGSSQGPGPLHRRLRTEGKTQGTEPQRAATSYLPSKCAINPGTLVPTKPEASISVLLWGVVGSTLPPQPLCLGSEEKL